MPRAGLTPERVVAGAEVLADEVGLSRLTLAELANRLGVRLPSLYKHVNGMDALQRELAIRAKIEIGSVLARSAVGRSGPDAVRALAGGYRVWAKQHPGRYVAIQRAPDLSDEEDAAASTDTTNVLLDALAGFGLTGVDAIDAARALRSALHGFVSLELESGFGFPVDIDRSFERMVAGVVRSLETWPSAEESLPHP